MEESLEMLIKKHNESQTRSQGRVIFPNERLASLWIHELIGQLSDGAWENHWYDKQDSWEDYTSLQIQVDEDLTSAVFQNTTIEGELPDFLARNSTRNDDLVDIIGSRMVDYVQRYGYDDYTKDDVRDDLLRLNDAEIQ